MPKPKKATDAGETSGDSIPQTTASKLRKLIIQNFGCIGASPVIVELDDIVVLVGANNAGKSTILRADERRGKHQKADGKRGIHEPNRSSNDSRFCRGCFSR